MRLSLGPGCFLPISGGIIWGGEVSAVSPARAERFVTSETAQIEVYGRMGHLVGSLKNLSKTGAFFELLKGDYIPLSGDVLHLTIHLRSVRRTHSVDAEVVWQKGVSFGVHFVNKDQVLEKIMQSKNS